MPLILRRRAALVGAASLLFACSDSTPPNAANDHVEATVGPSGATVVTPSGAAGVQIPAGTLTQTVTVSVAQIATPSTPATGPLPTNLKQYGPFYEIETSPSVQFADSVRVGVCQVTDPSSRYYAPEAEHAKLKLAHTVGATVEILKPVPVNDFLRCTGVSASVDQSGWRGTLSRLLGGAHVSVAYAAHGGLGGKVKSFSPFGAVLDACGDTAALAFGVTASGSIVRTDCELLNTGPAPVSGDIFRFSLASQSMFRATSTGGTELLLRVDQIASQPSDGDKISEVVVPRLDYFILPAGNYSMSIHNRSTANATDNIPYTLGIQTVAAITGCPANLSQQTYIYPGIVYNGSVATDDCPTTVQGLFGDNYWITMVPTSTYQISASANIGLRIELVLCCTGSSIPVRFASSGPGTVSMTYQPPTAALYVLNVIGNTLSAPVGPYTLRVTKQ